MVHRGVSKNQCAVMLPYNRIDNIKPHPIVRFRRRTAVVIQIELLLPVPECPFGKSLARIRDCKDNILPVLPGLQGNRPALRRVLGRIIISAATFDFCYA